MNWEIFGLIGYLGLALGAAAIVSWLVYWKIPSKLLCRIGLGLTVGALACATLNSKGHVARIQVDPAAQIEAAKALEEAKRQAVLQSRGEEVAQIQFAEDSGDEFLDKAGLDEEDLKYLESYEEPAWKKTKKSRTGRGAEDDSLEALIDDEEQEGGADVAEIEEESGPEPIFMDEADMVKANRFDRWNLRVSEWLLVIAILMLGIDYLRRFNIYREASAPLPLPSSLPNAFTPAPPIIERTSQPRRELHEELAWLRRRGDSFLYLTDSASKAADAVARLEPLTRKRRPLDLLRVGEEKDLVDDDFVFEALWFGRASFVVDSADRAGELMKRLVELTVERQSTRARARQNVHVVWDLESEVPPDLRQVFSDFAGPAGFSLLVA